MSSLRCCEYEELAGKTIRLVRSSSDLDGLNLSIDFTDETRASFRFSLAIDQEAGASDLRGGNPAIPRALTPTPVRVQVKPLELTAHKTDAKMVPAIPASGSHKEPQRD